MTLMALAWLLSGRCRWHGAVLGSAHLSEALQSATFTASGGFSCELSHISSFASGGPLHCVAPVPPPAHLPGWHNGTTGWLPLVCAPHGSSYRPEPPGAAIVRAGGTVFHQTIRIASRGPLALHCVATVPPPARLPGWHNGTTGWLPSDGAHWGLIYPSMAPEHAVPFANGTLCHELHRLYAGSRRYIILFLLSLLLLLGSIPGVEAAPQEQSYQCHTMDGYFLVKCPHCKQVCPLSVDLC